MIGFTTFPNPRINAGEILIVLCDKSAYKEWEFDRTQK